MALPRTGRLHTGPLHWGSHRTDPPRMACQHMAPPRTGLQCTGRQRTVRRRMDPQHTDPLLMGRQCRDFLRTGHLLMVHQPTGPLHTGRLRTAPLPTVRQHTARPMAQCPPGRVSWPRTCGRCYVRRTWRWRRGAAARWALRSRRSSVK